MIKVSKEVAEAIEQLRESRSDEDIFYHATNLILTIDRFNKQKKAAIRVLNEISPLKLARALAIGYEIEISPEEMVNRRIRAINGTLVNFREEKLILDAEMQGIKLVVDAFNLKGVNVK